MSRGIGDSNVLQKRIPRSARYDNVRAKTDTGASMSKHMARVNEIQNNYRIQKGEERVLIVQSYTYKGFHDFDISCSAASRCGLSDIDRVKFRMVLPSWNLP